MIADVEEARALSAWAGLLADRTRAGFCLALLDGRAWTVGELARHAGVAMSTASEHLDRLVRGGMLVEHRQGRHRYVSLAGPEVAGLIEAVTGAATTPAATNPSASEMPVAGAGRPSAAGPPPGSLAAVHRRRNLAFARTCYDHLAGRLGVALADAVLAEGWIRRADGLVLTPLGRSHLERLGFAGQGRRPVLRDCLDWTERRPHLAGQVGAFLCGHALAAGWVERIGSGRAVRLTGRGAAALRDQFGLVIDRATRDGSAAARAAPAGGRPR